MDKIQVFVLAINPQVDTVRQTELSVKKPDFEQRISILILDIEHWIRGIIPIFRLQIIDINHFNLFQMCQTIDDKSNIIRNKEKNEQV